jgi:hypothetical protein
MIDKLQKDINELFNQYNAGLMTQKELMYKIMGYVDAILSQIDREQE